MNAKSERPPSLRSAVLKKKAKSANKKAKKKSAARGPRAANDSGTPMDVSFGTSFFAPEALARMLVHFINHRLTETADPITQTLILMVNAPVQLVLCETGLIPFQTEELPVYPFSKMSKRQREFLVEALKQADAEKLHTQVQYTGRFTTKLLLQGKQAYFLRHQAVLQGFGHAMQENCMHKEQHIQDTIRNIIQQRFLAATSVQAQQPCGETSFPLYTK